MRCTRLHEGLKNVPAAGQHLAPGSAGLGQSLPGAQAEAAQGALG